MFDFDDKILNFNKKQRVKGLPSDLAPVTKNSDRKVFDQKRIKILTLKTRIPITRDTNNTWKVKPGNASEQ